MDFGNQVEWCGVYNKFCHKHVISLQFSKRNLTTNLNIYYLLQIKGWAVTFTYG